MVIANMRVLVVIAVVVAAAASVTASANFTTIKDLEAIGDATRIIGGQEAVVGQFPWQVTVNYHSSGRYFLCGGSLIDENWVLTAAHCAQSATSFDLKFGGITRNSYEKGRVDIKATSYIVHPNYSSENLNNDIALIKLPHPIKFNERIRPIKLPARGDKIGAYRRVVVSGWGKTAVAGSTSRTLRYVRLDTIPNEACAKVYGSHVIESSTLCCSGSAKHSSCNGDSGGPLVLLESNDAVLVGIVSFVHGLGCATGDPSGFVRTESYTDWIHRNTGIQVSRKCGLKAKN